MNVIIVSRNGILDNPILIQNDTRAECEFDSIIEKLLTDDELDELRNDVDYSFKLDSVNKLLNCQGIEISWFTDIDITK